LTAACVITNLFRFTAGHLFYTQLISQQIELSRQKNTSDIFQGIIKIVIWIEINYIEKLWEVLTANKGYAILLTCLAEERSVYKYINNTKLNIPRILRDLRNQGVIIIENNRYEFLDPLFAIGSKIN